jgi:hypothetical protein
MASDITRTFTKSKTTRTRHIISSNINRSGENKSCPWPLTSWHCKTINNNWKQTILWYSGRRYRVSGRWILTKSWPGLTVNMKFEVPVFWDMTPRSFGDICRRFREMFWLYLEGRRVKMMKYVPAKRRYTVLCSVTSKMTVIFTFCRIWSSHYGGYEETPSGT